MHNEDEIYRITDILIQRFDDFDEVNTHDWFFFEKKSEFI
jgi:hypothetical protein